MSGVVYNRAYFEARDAEKKAYATAKYLYKAEEVARRAYLNKIHSEECYDKWMRTFRHNYAEIATQHVFSEVLNYLRTKLRPFMGDEKVHAAVWAAAFSMSNRRW